jgi:hypothetical protein
MKSISLVWVLMGGGRSVPPMTTLNVALDRSCEAVVRKPGTLRPGARGGDRRGPVQGGVKREDTKRGGAARRRVASPRLLFRLITGCLFVPWDVLLSWNGFQREGGRRRAVALRILVCLENDYRSYREVIAAGIQILRPHTEVVSAELDGLEDEVRNFDPHLVICSLPATANNREILCWVELSLEDPTQATLVCVDGRYSEHNNPTLENLLTVLDEVEQLL